VSNSSFSHIRVGNVHPYFSGHYVQHHGLNIQEVIVDHLGGFLYVVVAAPGSQPDLNAFKRAFMDMDMVS
jgi:hypothetical protein